MSSSAKVISLRVFAIVHATEDLGKVTQAILNISQVSWSAEPVARGAKGHHGNQITTLELIVKNPKAAHNCLRYIWSRLRVLDKDTILSNLDSRVDTSGTLFIRIDKQDAFKGTVSLEESDPIKVRVSLKTSGSKPHGVVGEIQKFLTEIDASVAKYQ